MTKEEYLAKLNEAFHDFKFFPSDHHYEYKGKRIGISATTLIEQYTQPFDAETVAERVANKEGKSVQQVLDEWKYKNDFSKVKGTTCHEYIQAKWELKYWELLNFDGSYEYFEAVEKIKKQADNFKKDYKDKLELIANEYIIGSFEFDIASAVDALFVNKLTGGLVLVDYKTNSLLNGYNKQPYKKSMKIPLQHLNDDSLHHYYLQLSIYKYLIEKYAKIKVDDMFIVYMSENIENYQIINMPYLEKEAELMLEWNKWN